MKLCVLISIGLLASSIEAQTAVRQRGGSSEADLVHMPGTPDCFLGASRMGDPTKEASIMKMQGSSGCSVPWHWHPADEHIMMVSGSGRAQVKGDVPVVLKAGDFYSAHSKHVMRFACVSQCTLFVYTDGAFAIHYVDDDGHEIPPEEALKRK